MTVGLQGSEMMLNGKWLGRNEALVSVFDRGFIFGDGVYEVIPAYFRKPFLADRHIERLQRSLDEVDIDNPLSPQAWADLINEMAARQEFDHQRIYLQVTRGVAPRLHRYPLPRVAPTYMMFADEMALVDDGDAKRGFKGVTRVDFRWRRGDIKSISLIAAVMSSEIAAQAGATETIFIRDGLATEGASSNLLMVKDGRIISPVVDPRILAGITLSFVVEVAAEAGIELEFRDIPEAELHDADEVMILSSGKEIVAITRLDEKDVGDGVGGPVFDKLRAAYKKQTGLGG